ncbi:MAG: thermonuclease family protein [Bacteroidetes bacterium]|nr:thermonuclease family protein [Bacteroidota bacterium]
MKKLLLLLPILFSCFISSAQLVVQVIDGDTYKVLDKGKLKVIRLANVDAPEMDQYYGKLVKAAVSKLILAKTIGLDERRPDRYGRMIADVTINGKSLDSLMVANGWAWHYVSVSLNPSLTDYQVKAIDAKAGFWKCNHNVPPWVWRKLNKRQKRLKEMCR